MKKIVTIATVFALLIGLNTNSVSADEQFKVSRSDVVLSLNGTTLNNVDSQGNYFDILNINGSTYVPVRFLSESAGMDVEYNKQSQSVNIKKAGVDATTTSSVTLGATPNVAEITTKINDLSHLSDLNEAISSYLMTLESQGIYIEELVANGYNIKATPSDIERAITTVAEKQITLETLSVTAGSPDQVLTITLEQR